MPQSRTSRKHSRNEIWHNEPFSSSNQGQDANIIWYLFQTSNRNFDLQVAAKRFKLLAMGRAQP